LLTFSLCASLTLGGLGIPDRNAPDILELFFSAEKPGAGVRLTYCRKVLQLMEASIRLSAKQGSPCTKFTLNFPKKKGYFTQKTLTLKQQKNGTP